mmetsp:Transcript_18559/g.27544  ORF Transcript_18559/g.27544 Transcript_18559/m.27544 type:complete len:539 (-) Transcript_18559:23-1639(-)
MVWETTAFILLQVWLSIIATFGDTITGIDFHSMEERDAPIQDTTVPMMTRNADYGGGVQQRPHVPFFAVGTPAVDFTSLVHAMNEHRESISSSLKNLDRSYRIARASEYYMLFRDTDDDDNDDGLSSLPLSSSLERRIERIATLLEADMLVLESLLDPFDLIHALPEPPDDDDSSASASAARQCGHSSYTDASSSNDGDIAQHAHNSNDPPSRKDDGTATVTDYINSPSSYDSVMHAISHIVRDWTILGKDVRKSTYTWCVDELHELYEENVRSITKVLVPGAGLARLSYDIALSGFNVDANECSLVMSAVAHKFLHGIAAGSLHPFCYDSLMNEVDSQLRYEEAIFPEEDTGPDHMVGTMSYTIGDFILAYSPAAKHMSFDSVVTCFFIDTATNVYEYITIINHVLRDGGTWVNLGPLQWHRNALITPSADELKIMIHSMGFTINKWSIDQNMVNYRSEFDNHERFTRVEGYHALHFVATKNSCRQGRKINSCTNDPLTKILLMRDALQREQSGDRQYGSYTQEHEHKSKIIIEELD